MKQRFFMLGMLATLLMPVVAAGGADQRPNVVLILADDHRRDLMSCMGHEFLKTPNFDRIAAEGLLFERAFSVTATCSPSRASIWTGKYPHQASHPAISQQANSFLLTQVPFPRRLHDAGYTVGHVGKWHLTHDLEQQPGYDFWAGTHMMPVDDPTITINGKDQQFKGFIDDVLCGIADGFIQRHSRDEEPFFLYVGLKCPHLPYPYPARLSHLFENDDIPKPDTYREKFGQSGRAPILNRSTILIRNNALWKARYKTWDNYIKRHYRSVQSLDESIGRIDAALRKAGVADNTILIYSSDHGYSLGEHGFTEKHFAYRHPTSVPLIVRWPKMIEGGVRPQEMTLLIDLAPTVLESCGVPVPPDMRGRSLVPLFKANDKPIENWRKDFLFTYDSRNGNIPSQYALRTEKFKLVCYQDHNFIELYDLEKDPEEKQSVARKPEYREVLNQMKQRLEDVMKEQGYTFRKQRFPLKTCLVRPGMDERQIAVLSKKLHQEPLNLEAFDFKVIESTDELFDVSGFSNDDGVLLAVPIKRLTEWDPFVAMWVDQIREARLWFNGEVLWHWTPERKREAGHLLNPPLIHQTETALIELIGKKQKPVRLYLEAPAKSIKLPGPNELQRE